MARRTPRPLSSTGCLRCAQRGPLLLLSDILRGHRNVPQPHIQGRFLAATPCPHLHPYQNIKIRTRYSSCRDSRTSRAAVLFAPCSVGFAFCSIVWHRSVFGCRPLSSTRSCQVGTRQGMASRCRQLPPNVILS